MKKYLWGLLCVLVVIGMMGCGASGQSDSDSESEKKKTEDLVINAEKKQEETSGEKESKESESSGRQMTELEQKVTELLNPLSGGSDAAVYIEKLTTGDYATISSHQMQAASLIKLYIAGCVYENYEELCENGVKEARINSLMEAMITVSDNDAANQLVIDLGNGDGTAGREKVNAYCQSHGYTESHMGRMLLAPNDQDDNYTSVADCGKFLRDVYQDKAEGAAKIVAYMKQQQRTLKIPAGVPSGVVVANKTGELADVENDAAIVYLDQQPYILCVMTQGLSDASAARQVIVHVSDEVYQYMKDGGQS